MTFAKGKGIFKLTSTAQWSRGGPVGQIEVGRGLETLTFVAHQGLTLGNFDFVEVIS